MRKSLLAGLTTAAVASGALLGTTTPAQAADGDILYVNQKPAACSDTGSGTLAQPFCTIGAAAAVVAAGQTVDITSDLYPERVVISRSGTPGQPITFRGNAPGTYLTGPTGGIVIDGQHDITIQNLWMIHAVDVPGLEVSNASAITVDGVRVGGSKASAVPAVRLSAVTASTLKRLTVPDWNLATGLTMDAATSGVTVSDSYLEHKVGGTTSQATAIHVAGSNNTIVNNYVKGFGGAGIAIGSGATGTVVANNQISQGTGYGIRNSGATGTAITNNTVQDRCLDGIRVDGASAGVSVQNNVLSKNGSSVGGSCDSPGVEIAVHAAASTQVDYNNTDHGTVPGEAYSWNGTRMGLAAFRTASGQASHDKATNLPADSIDSANSAAPGYQATDRFGAARLDDQGVPNTGAGPVTYADRGMAETMRPPVARNDVAVDLRASSVKVNSSASSPGTYPIASYLFEFGDGTSVSQTSPIASHRYAKPGDYSIRTTVTGTDNRSNSRTTAVTLRPWIGSVGLLALHNRRYVAHAPNHALGMNQTGLVASAEFDLADANNGQVNLVRRATGKYVTASETDELLTANTTTSSSGVFAVVANSDGTISLRSKETGGYVGPQSSTSPNLTAKHTTIGTSQKFYRVNLTDAARSLKASANGRYVTASKAGAGPLIAAQTKVGGWERYDVIELGNGQIALFSRANNRFVSADSAGTKPLIANRDTVGLSERFRIIPNSDGTVSIRAAVNSRYVTAEDAGAKPLIARGATIGLWEKFTLG
ncbi:right-handed parallel beta-helix repeat-containing protein [Micromonospora sp. CA-259024]|uniref:right-handed parallel beta-helix repeat-containing protein n=1 Tax=Micromonospora sp. CA-259024 TaxID=3239965 RepID=UPI003D931328